jgi:hypothetical protein
MKNCLRAPRVSGHLGTAFRLLSLFAALTGSSAQASIMHRPLLDITGGFTNYSVAFLNATEGFRFSVATPTTIVALGIFDVGSNGLTNSHEVGLWNETGTLLASLTVTNSATAVASSSAFGRWLAVDLPTPVVLGSGNYHLGAFYRDVNTNPSEDGVLMGATVSSQSGISYLGWAYSTTLGTALLFPGGQGPNQSQALTFGPMAFTQDVPEPATGVLGGAFLLIGAALARRRR